MIALARVVDKLTVEVKLIGDTGFGSDSALLVFAQSFIRVRRRPLPRGRRLLDLPLTERLLYDKVSAWTQSFARPDRLKAASTVLTAAMDEIAAEEFAEACDVNPSALEHARRMPLTRESG